MSITTTSCITCVLREMASLTDYFNQVSTEEYIAAFFISTERGKKTVKWPVGRPGKHPLESECQVQADKGRRMYLLMARSQRVRVLGPFDANTPTSKRSVLDTTVRVASNRASLSEDPRNTRLPSLHTCGSAVNFRIYAKWSANCSNNIFLKVTFCFTVCTLQQQHCYSSCTNNLKCHHTFRYNPPQYLGCQVIS